jgi:hypothetical protein
MRTSGRILVAVRATLDAVSATMPAEVKTEFAAR